MSYTLKSNAINSAATFFFVGENGLTDLVASATVTAVGTSGSTTTVGGHTEYAYSGAANNYLSATVGAIPTGTAFCILLVGRPSANADDSDRYVTLQGGADLVGTTFSPARMRSVLDPLGGSVGPELTGYTHPATVQHIWIYGRESDNSIRHGFNATPVQVAAPSTNSTNISTTSGEWKFGGTPSASGLAGFGVGIFAVFVGVAPSDVWAYVDDGGNNGGATGPERVYAALLQEPSPDADLTGSITLDAIDTIGSIASNVALLTGDITLADVLASGNLGLVPGSIRTLPFARNNGTRPTGLINVAVAVLSDDANLSRLAGSTAITQNGDGTISFSGAGLPGVGTSVIVITREPDGKLGAERYLVT